MRHLTSEQNEEKKKHYEDSPLEENIESSGGSSFFFFPFFRHLFVLLPLLLFAISHCIRWKELFERRTTAKPPDEPTLRPDLRGVMEERSGHRCLELLLTVFVTRIYGQPCEMIATGNVGASGLAGIVEFTGYR